MLSAGRSLTEPPGLSHSALALNSTLGNSRPTRSSRNRGVLPIRSSKDSPTRPISALLFTEASAVCLVVAMFALNQESPLLACHRQRRLIYSELDASTPASDISRF